MVFYVVFAAFFGGLFFLIDYAKSASLRPDGVVGKFFKRAGASFSGTRIFFDHSKQRIDVGIDLQKEGVLVTLTVPASTRGRLRVEPEGSLDELLEATGLQGRIKTQDARFDSAFHVTSEDQAFASRYFASAEHRKAATALFESGCRVIEIDEEGLHADWMIRNIEDSPDDAFLKDALPLLTLLSRGLPRPTRPEPAFTESVAPEQSEDTRLAPAASPEFDRLVAFRNSFLTVLSILTGIFFSGDPNVGSPLDGEWFFLQTLPLSLAAAAAYLFYIAYGRKGSTSFGTDMARAGWIAVFFVPGGYMLARDLNSALDRGAPTFHRAPILRKWAGKKQKFYLSLASWRSPEHQLEVLAVDFDDFRKAMPQTMSAEVVTKPGLFGYEWIQEWSLGEQDRSAVERIQLVDRRNDGTTSLMRAAYIGDDETVTRLLDKGMDVNEESGRSGCSAAISCAAHQGRMATVRLLVKRGAAITPEALKFAACNADLEMVRFLLDHGAKPDEVREHTSWTPLMCASGNSPAATGPVLAGRPAKRLDVVKELLDHGADVNAQTIYYDDVRTALREAREHGNEDIVILLKERGAER